MLPFMRDSEKEKHWTYEGSFLMGRKGIKIPNDIKLKYAKLCYEGRMSITTASLELGVTFQAAAEWVCRYRKQGSLAFEDTGRTAFIRTSYESKPLAVIFEGRVTNRDCC